MDYLKKRIEGTFSKPEPVAKVVKQVAENEKVPENADTILDDHASRVRDSQAEEFKKGYDEASAKLIEFKSNEGIFKNLISCVLGGLGG